ncbi:MAG: class I SAM-dependent methyltransferase [Blastocatellia bacterium]|nr:class I SAM-dependent methyltransferase [Blastocatellia bacterium]
MKIRLKPLLGGLVTTLIPSLAATMGRRNQPRVSAEYYYTVWMRHVCSAAHFQCWNNPQTILEIGPGTELGTGIAALLSGIKQYIAYDSTPWLPQKLDDQLFQELVRRFRQREAFAERDRIVPSTSFPKQLFPDEQLCQILSDEGIGQIKQSAEQRNHSIRYLNSLTALPDNSVDYLFSHSVLEHVESLEAMYNAMWRWLRPGGVMTHSVDFSSHGTSTVWNGHWTIPDGVWRLMHGKRRYFINREPASTHRRLLEQMGFEIKGFHLSHLESRLKPTALAQRFRNLSESDLQTCSVFIVAQKPL